MRTTEPKADDLMSGDVTGWCEKAEHEGCSGILRAATGHHWWCACACHPEPTPPDTDDGRKALAVWAAARNPA